MSERRRGVTMGQLYGELHEGIQEFIGKQHMFFVATAPLSEEGRVNLSPKGLDSFRVLGPKTVGYLDLVGSGIETVAHLQENGRMTIMFCSFAGRPLILRLYGVGRAVTPEDAEWAALIGEFPAYFGARSLVVLDVDRIATSCGFGVPRYEYQGDRSQLFDWAEKKGHEGLERYKAEKNARSIDGLKGL